MEQEIRKANTLNREVEKVREILVNREEIKEKYEERRNKVLAKNPDDIVLADLPYIKINDPIYPKLKFRYKREIKLRDDTEFIFEQMDEILPLLTDDSINEINLNPDGSVWVLKVGEGMFKTDIVLDADKALNLMSGVAYAKKVDFDEKRNPIMSVKLPSGERMTCVAGEPVNDCPTFSIRKPPSKIFTLDDYVNDGKMTENQKKVILEEIKKGSNILAVGGVGTGKTTFGNAILNELKNTTKRVIMIEDVPELICDCDNKVPFTTSESANVDLVRLLRVSMRFNGDIVVLGEILDGNAAQTLTALWNSGSKGGFSTIHGNDANGGVKKIIQYSSLGGKVSDGIIQDIISAINCVVVLKKDEKGVNKVAEIAKLKGYNYDLKEFEFEEIK